MLSRINKKKIVDVQIMFHTPVPFVYTLKDFQFLIPT